MGESPAWRSAVSLVEETAAVIRERIFAGRYVPGERLPQAELSRELGLSRTPLREGLRMLEQEGLVQAGSEGAARVATATAAELSDIYEFRAPVEGTAARLACRRISPGMLEALRQTVELQNRELDPWQERRFSRLHARFHTLLLEASGNRIIERQSALVRMAEQVFRPALGTTAAAARTAAGDSAAVVRAIADGDAEAAEQAIRRHLSTEQQLISEIQGESE